MQEHLLLLWDVDHTLVETRGVGSLVFAEAFETVTGRPMSAGMADAHGHTEPILLEQTLDLNGIHDRDPDLFERFANAQVESYVSHLAELRESGSVLPGAEAALRTFSLDPHITQTVLTGNTRKAAQIKLAAFDLDRYLDLEVGAYGDDQSSRPALVDVALSRASRKYAVSFSSENSVLIGDTPRDIEAARLAGLYMIAVATGNSSASELWSAGANMVVESLEEIDGLVKCRITSDR